MTLALAVLTQQYVILASDSLVTLTDGVKEPRRLENATKRRGRGVVVRVFDATTLPVSVCAAGAPKKGEEAEYRPRAEARRARR